MAGRSSQGAKVIEFENPDEKIKGFHELLSTKANFTGIGKGKYVLTEKQCEMLRIKKIKFHELD